MALSRIWSAFIIIAVLVAGIRMAAGDEKIFTRMVVGKSSEKYDSVFYYGIGSPLNQKLSPAYADFLKEYGSRITWRMTLLLSPKQLIHLFLPILMFPSRINW